jgi:hypothetical protein
MRHNPLLAQLLRKTGPPALWLTIVFGAVVAAWVSLTMAAEFNTAAQTPYGILGPQAPAPVSPLYFVALLLLTGAPVTVGVNAAVFTSRHAQPDNLKSLKLTNLSGTQIAWGYGLAALYRMRVLIALAVGLAPAFAIVSAETAMMGIERMERYPCIDVPCSGPYVLPAAIAAQDMVGSALTTIGVVGLIALAAAFGTWMALTSRSPLLMTVIPVAGTALAMIACASALGAWTFTSIPATALIMVAPYLLSAGIMALAGR